MKSIKGIFLLGIFLTMPVVSLHATSSYFTDSYAGKTVAATTNGGDIGTSYAISSADSTTTITPWALSSNYATVNSSGYVPGDTLVWQPSWQLGNSSSSNSFTVSGSLYAGTTNSWIGLAVNWQSSDEFYAVRFEPGNTALQLVYYISGSNAAHLAASSTLPFTPASGTEYTLSVSSSSGGAFTWTITSGGASGGVTASGTLTDSSARYTSGYAGFYLGSGEGFYNNLDITTNDSTASYQQLSNDQNFDAGLNILNFHTGTPYGSLTVPAGGTVYWTEMEANPQSSGGNYVTLYDANGYSGTQADGSTLWSIDVDGCPTSAASGSCVPQSCPWSYANQDGCPTYESVALAPTATPKPYDFTLSENSWPYYNGVYRTSTQTWPNSYLSQKLLTGFGGHNAVIPVSELQQLQISLSAMVPITENYYGTGYNANLHASHFAVYVTVQNLNNSSSDYGKYMFFNMLLYNDTSAKFNGGASEDGGTGMYNYQVGMGPFSSAWLNNSSYTLVRRDILPMIKEGLMNAWNYPLMTASENMSDYYVTSIHIGWEVNGLSYVQAQVKDMSLIATY